MSFSNISNESWCQTRMPQIALLFPHLAIAPLLIIVTVILFHLFARFHPPSSSPSSLSFSLIGAIISHMLFPVTKHEGKDPQHLLPGLCPLRHSQLKEPIFPQRARVSILTHLFFSYLLKSLLLHLLCHTEQLPV